MPLARMMLSISQRCSIQRRERGGRGASEFELLMIVVVSCGRGRPRYYRVSAPANGAVLQLGGTMAKSGKKTAHKPRVYVTHSDTIVESQLVTLPRMRAAAKRFPGLLSRVEIVHGDDRSSLDASLPETDVLLLSGNIDLTNLKARAPKLRWIQSCSAGVEKVAPFIPAAITLTNASGVHGPRGGEYGMAAVLMLNSRVPGFVT